MCRGSGRNGKRESECIEVEGYVSSQILHLSLVHVDGPAEEKKLYHQLVVDTHVYLVREVERRLRLVDSDTSER